MLPCRGHSPISTGAEVEAWDSDYHSDQHPSRTVLVPGSFRHPEARARIAKLPQGSACRGQELLGPSGILGSVGFASQSQIGPRRPRDGGACWQRPEEGPAGKGSAQETLSHAGRPQGPQASLPTPARLPCQRQRVCENPAGQAVGTEGAQGSRAVVTLFLQAQGEGGFLKMVLHSMGIQLLQEETGTRETAPSC